ncbi:unnamed protein product [Ectocarpus sp. 8 AP-2014]
MDLFTDGCVWQVKPFTEKVGSASEAGVAAVLEQGRASLENLQAEADRISAQVASPVADKLSAGSRLSEAFGRGRDGVLKAVGEAGRAVDQGVSAVDGLPALKGQASGLSARILETSGRALSRATGTAGEIYDKMSGGLADLAGRGPGILARVRSISARLFSSDDHDGALVGGVTAEAAAAAAVAVAVVAGGAATAIGRSGSGDGGGVAETGAEGIGASGNAGRRGDDVVEQGEERRLQPIGGGGGGGTGVAAGEGGWEGEGAEEKEEEGEGEVLQPVGVKLETGATNDGERYGEEAISASSTLWDMIRGSGTGAGDAVREVSEVG